MNIFKSLEKIILEKNRIDFQNTIEISIPTNGTHHLKIKIPEIKNENKDSPPRYLNPVNTLVLSRVLSELIKFAYPPNKRAKPNK